MPLNNFLALEARINELEANLEYRDDIYQRKKLSMFIDGWLLQETNVLTEMIDENVTVVCSLRRKVKMAIEHLKRNISNVECGIKMLEQMSQWKLHKKRRNNMFVVEPSLKKQNCRYSYYFQDDSSYCKHANCDINNIIDSGYKFLSCIKKPVQWTQKDKDFLFKGLRECTMMMKWEELEEAIDSKHDVNVISSLKEDFNKLQDTEGVSFKTLVYDQIVRDDIDWTFISNRYLHKRHSPEDCERMWKLVIGVSLIVPEFTPEERILLRYLVKQNNFQNWENINAQMPTQRSEFMYFVDFFSKNKGLVKKEFISKKISVIAQRSTLDLRSNYANTSWVTGPRPKKGIIRKQLSKRQRTFMIEYLRKGYSVSAVNRILGTRFSPDWMNKFIVRYNDKLTNRWTSKETSKLLKTVKYIGTERWSSISKFVGKSPWQCRCKYYRLLSQNKTDTKCMDGLKDSRLRMKHISKFLRSSKSKSQVDLVNSIQYYFSQCQENSKRHNNVFDKISVTSHVVNLFKHLKIDIELSKAQILTLGKFLANPKNIDNLKIKTIFKKISKSMKLSPENLKVTPGDGTFTNVVYKADKVLPPNKCTIYGLYNLMKNQEIFAADNPTNYELLWNQLNQRYKCDKNFIHAKIQWYRILEALFYWPLKLKTIFPENILND